MNPAEVAVGAEREPRGSCSRCTPVAAIPANAPVACAHVVGRAVGAYTLLWDALAGTISRNEVVAIASVARLAIAISAPCRARASLDTNGGISGRGRTRIANSCLRRRTHRNHPSGRVRCSTAALARSGLALACIAAPPAVLRDEAVDVPGALAFAYGSDDAQASPTELGQQYQLLLLRTPSEQ